MAPASSRPVLDPPLTPRETYGSQVTDPEGPFGSILCQLLLTEANLLVMAATLWTAG